MRIAVDIGHNRPPDTGASGFGSEDKMNRLIGESLITKLIKAGVDVIDCRPSSATTVTHSLQKRCTAANQGSADYCVSIHHNAGGGKGVEVFGISGTAKAIAATVVDSIASLGFKSRGVKSKSFYVLKNTAMPAILIEVCFVDNKEDVELWESLGHDKIAQAIFEGLNDALKFA
jgi:N-acetylmuramoyl-L-alanine amidase